MAGNHEPTNDIWEAMGTARAIRRWKPDPVPEGLIWRLVEAATKAPSGGNAQPWGFLVITDVYQKNQLGQLVRERETTVGAIPAWRTELADEGIDPSRRKILEGAIALFEQFDSAPLIIVPCLSFPDGPPLEGMSGGRNIYPAVQNLLLAARALGLGAVLTGVHRLIEPEMRELFALPSHVTPACVIPIGYPAANFGPVRRHPPEQVTHWGTWGARRVRAD
jgi:nitroreductase